MDTKDLALIIDYKFCYGCHSCEIACCNAHDFADGEWGIKVTEYRPEILGDAWYWNFIPVPSTLCDLCADRLAEGKDPTCVHHCLAKCIEAVPLAEVPERMAALGGQCACYLPR